MHPRHSDGVRVTRFDEGDYGTEIRVEVTLDGRTLELVAANGVFGRHTSLWEVAGDDLDTRYRDGKSLFEEKDDA